ncbi:DHHA1 domain-containing protein [Gemmatimonas sp.]|uniref:alanyl-tRNA editing protein n=1 Tax=Gemmatimonas sp. TaxID=1962908 RepID=UPI0025B7E6FE|nr:DHHA1 domain-containing protein [Gemmatimonas sp.]MCA2993030.1 alanyl-tRNA editing protein [Gemmatimonas sp.]
MTAPTADHHHVTTRLYYDDARLARFSATVTAVAEEGTVVYLDRTAFYPTSGGQPHDVGTLADVAVVDVIDEETRVAHRLAQPLGLALGAMVVGHVDTERRLDHMQQHTAQHLLSALLADEYGWATVSVHFGDLASTVDVACAEGIGAAQLARIEQRVNALLRAQHAVQVSYEEAATATGLRKASDRDGTLRIITIAGLDRSACGGTHLANTAEIGAILLRGAERTRGHTRIEFLAGDRVLRRAHGDAALLTRAARPLSAAPGDLPALVEQQVARLAELERDRKRLLAELAGHEAEALWQNSAVDAHGVRRVRHRVAGAVKDAEPLVQQLLSRGPCVVLVANDATGAVLLGASPDASLDAGQTLRAALQHAGGRGGGSPRLAQGALPDAAALPALATALGF